MQEKIKSLRLEIDALAQLVNTMRGAILFRSLLTDGIAIKNCQQSLLFSKAWLGKCMGALGVETPYKNDGHRKEVKDIEPTADRNSSIFGDDLEKIDFETMNYVEKIDFCRQKINPIISRIENIISNDNITERPVGNLLFNLAIMNSHQHLCESRFHLGFELEQIREKTAERNTDLHG